MKRIFLYFLIILAFKVEAAEFVVFNVGQGNCNLFIPDQTPSGAGGTGFSVLYDAGSDHYPETFVGDKIDKSTVIDEITSTTEAEIKKITQKITANLSDVGKNVLNLVVSHAHTDHYSYILSILSKLDKQIIYNFYFGGLESQYPQKFMDEIKKIPPARRPQFFFADTPGKTSPKIGTSYNCQYLSWLDDKDKNATSLVLKISRSLPFTNPFSILLMGDATGKTTDGIDTLKVKDTTLLVANHHGSATDGSNSEKWISISNPKIVVFSASKSKHGHPDKEVMSRYLKSPSNLPWPIHEFSYSGDSFLNARPSLVTYHTEPEKQNKRSYFRALIRKALLNTMNEGTLRFNFTDSSPSLMQPQKYLSMFPLIHITNFALVEAEITNDEYIQIAPKLHLLKLLTAVDFSKNKLRIKDSADNVMVAFTKALLEAASCITTLVFVENDIDNDYVKTTMNSETQFKKLIITDVK